MGWNQTKIFYKNLTVGTVLDKIYSLMAVIVQAGQEEGSYNSRPKLT